MTEPLILTPRTIRRAAGCRPGRISDLRTASCEDFHLIVTMNAARSGDVAHVVGQITDTDGEPIEGAALSLSTEIDPAMTTTTDELGEFLLPYTYGFYPVLTVRVGSRAYVINL